MVEHVASAGFRALFQVGSTLLSGSGFTSAPAMGIRLEPMATLVSLCTLAYRPKGTKLYINASGISYDEPGNKSKFTRRLMFASRDDLPVILTAIEQFKISYNFRHAHIRYICLGAIQGLKELSTCYDKDESGMTIVHCLQLYQGEIKSFLDQALQDTETKLSSIKKITPEELFSVTSEAPTSESTIASSGLGLGSPSAPKQESKKKKHRDKDHQLASPLVLSSTAPLGGMSILTLGSQGMSTNSSLYQSDHKDSMKFAKWPIESVQIVILMLQKMAALSSPVALESGGYEARSRKQQLAIDEWLRAIDIVIPISNDDI